MEPGKYYDFPVASIDSGKTFSVINPTTEEEIAKLPLGGKTDVNKAVAAAKKAFPESASTNSPSIHIL